MVEKRAGLLLLLLLLLIIDIVGRCRDRFVFAYALDERQETLVLGHVEYVGLEGSGGGLHSGRVLWQD